MRSHSMISTRRSVLAAGAATLILPTFGTTR